MFNNKKLKQRLGRQFDLIMELNQEFAKLRERVGNLESEVKGYEENTLDLIDQQEQINAILEHLKLELVEREGCVDNNYIAVKRK